MKSFIYADNAATTRLDDKALSSMMPFLTEEYGNSSQPYTFGRYSKKALSEARTRIASCIGADAKEIYFTSGGTESNNWVIKSLVEQKSIDVIITSCIEHHSVLNSCDAVSNFVKVIKLPVNKHGEVSCNTLKSALELEVNKHSDTCRVLVSIMTANNEIGTIEPIKELAEISHSYGALFHTDAVQAIGHIDINVVDLGVDFLSASAHKFNGPKGTGFLYVRQGVELNPYIDGGAQESSKRAGTENVASVVGMSIALQNNIANLADNMSYISRLDEMLLQQLNESHLDYVKNGSDNHIPGNISLSIKNSDGEMLLHRLDLKGICISTGSACDSVNTQVSHVIKAIGVDPEYSKGTIRISLGKYNSVDDIKTIVKELINVFS